MTALLTGATRYTSPALEEPTCDACFRYYC